MKTKSGDFVLPGDALGSLRNLFHQSGPMKMKEEIESLVAGTVSVDNKNKKISIIPKTSSPSMLKSGVIVMGQVSDVRGQRALIKLDSIKDKSRGLVTSFSGGIHISQAQKGYVAKLTDEFRIGDLIEAKVTKIIGIDNVDLTTAEDELGVLKAMCTKCRHYMKQTSKNEVECPNCGNKERRNLSSKYEG